MVELWLKYTDPSGAEQRALVDNERFSIGRHSDNDLTILDSRLSRDHAIIERYGDVFVLTDRGSSNGTQVDQETLSNPKTISDGETISFGGLEALVEMISKSDPGSSDIDVAAAAAPSFQPTPAQPAASEAGDFPRSILVIAPILALLILFGIGVVIYMGSSRTSNVVVRDGLDDTPSPRKTDETRPGDDKPGNLSVATPVNGNSTMPALPTAPTADANVGKTEVHASAFLRKIAQNDPRAFVIGEPAKAVYTKIKSIRDSSALAANINSARKDAAQIRSLAQSKNLRPDLLTAAAIAKLGNSGGDVLATARSMADTLDRLSTQLSNELGEECLVIIAAYDQGERGDFLKMRNMLQDVSTKMPDLARDIRTIWFLKKQGKITDAEYDFAVRFLAIGTVAQNPKDFGVNAEPLSF